MGNTAQFTFGASWKKCALISSLFLEIHKVFLQKSAIIRTHFFSGFALAELCGIALGETGFLKGFFFVLLSSLLWFFGIHGSDTLHELGCDNYQGYLYSPAQFLE